LENVEVDIDGVNIVANFEVIEGKYSYPSFLGIDSAYNNCVVINLKKEYMTFEPDGMKVVNPYICT
jgi:hypothetical protein